MLCRSVSCVDDLHHSDLCESWLIANVHGPHPFFKPQRKESTNVTQFLRDEYLLTILDNHISN